MAEKLQKIIAQAGITSRYKAEEMISAGQITVNGKKIAEPGTKVEPSDKIEVDGIPIEKEAPHAYLFYKPRDVISPAKGDEGRKTVVDFFEDVPYRLYPAGHPGYDTSGLLLMTNDGKLTNKLMYPRNEVPKVHAAKTKELLSPEDVHSLTHGVRIDGRESAPAKLKILKTDEKENIQIVQLMIHENRYHQVKRVFEAVHHFVEKLSRERYAFLILKPLTSGEYRELAHEEVFRLGHLAD